MSELPDRFWARVEKTDGCWNWIGYRTGKGYGIFNMSARPWRAHRLTYAERFGPIPEGLEMDHLCRNTSCVRPDHLEAVTPAENRRRQNDAITVCKLGHPLTAMLRQRRCRTCEGERTRRRRQQLAA